MSATAESAPSTIAGAETATSARLQVRLSALFISVLVAAVVLASAAFSGEALERFSQRLQIRQWERSFGAYAFHPLARDPGDYLLLRDLPKVDLHQGGVVFIGSSTLQHALITWELPADKAPYIHNFAIESANFREQYLWIRYLIEHKGLASAGPKMTVVLALSHLDTREKLPGLRDSTFVDDLFGRYGLFDYSPVAGLSPKPLSSVQRFVMEDEARISSAFQQLVLDLRDEALSHLPLRQKAQSNSDKSSMLAQMTLMGGPQRWRSAIDHQVGYLAKSIELLRQHNLNVRAVILPMRTFNDAQPFAKAFAADAARLCQSANVPLIDYSHMFVDTEFADGTHLNYAGHHRLSPLLLAPAIEHVAQIQLGKN